MTDLWTITEDGFDPQKQHHQETIFTLGNGYLCTRGAFEEGYPDDRRGTFSHGVFDEAPIVFTELANAPDWLPLDICLNGERFALDSGAILSFRRSLDLRAGLLTREVYWRSPGGLVARFIFERFASLVDEHRLFLRCRVTPEFSGVIEFRAGLNGNTHNEGLVHWQWLGQGERDGVIYLHNQTRKSGIEHAAAMQIANLRGRELAREFWDVQNAPTLMVKVEAVPGQIAGIDKYVAVFTSRDMEPTEVVEAAIHALTPGPSPTGRGGSPPYRPLPLGEG